MFWKWPTQTLGKHPANVPMLFDLKSKWRRFEDGVWSYVKDSLH